MNIKFSSDTTDALMAVCRKHDLRAKATLSAVIESTEFEELVLRTVKDKENEYRVSNHNG